MAVQQWRIDAGEGEEEGMEDDGGRGGTLSKRGTSVVMVVCCV
jgi:hypothetical protein